MEEPPIRSSHSGWRANVCRRFALVQVCRLVATVSNAQGGSDRQSKESIRFNAPLQYSAQDRAVTTSDYESLVRTLYPNAQSVSAWGGEDEETPVYGVVKIAIKAASGSTLTNTTKTDLVTQLKKTKVSKLGYLGDLKWN